VNGKCVLDTIRALLRRGSQGRSSAVPDRDRPRLHARRAQRRGHELRPAVEREQRLPPLFAQILYPAYPRPLDRALLFSFVQNLWDHGELDGYANHLTRDPLPGTPRHYV
jgi:hypothetical protein